MRQAVLALSLVSLTACPAPEDSGADDTDSYDLGDGTASDATAEVGDEPVSAWSAVSSVGNATSVAFSDPTVAAYLGETTFRTNHCWATDRVLNEITIDFTACTEYSGTIVLTRAGLTGPTRLTFGAFEANGTTLDGTLALDRSSTSPLRWDLTTTDATGSASADLTVEQADGTVALGLIGKLQLDTSALSLWGTGNATVGTTELALTLGGTADQVTSETPPGDALVWEVAPTSCACPTDGLGGAAITVLISSLQVDLDDLETRDDGVDSPSIAVPLDPPVSASGTITVEVTGCGAVDIRFVATEDVVVAVEGSDVAAAIQAACPSTGLPQATCDLYAAAATRLPTISVTIDADTLNAAAAEAAGSYDFSSCALP